MQYSMYTPSIRFADRFTSTQEKMKKSCIILSILFLKLFCGCLPPGEPPAGNITGNNLTVPQNPQNIRENAITELTAALLTYAPGENFYLDYDQNSAADIINVWNECAKFTGIKRVVKSDWQIISRMIDDQWQIKISHKGKIIWSVNY